jgi:hypothetical protein
VAIESATRVRAFIDSESFTLYYIPLRENFFLVNAADATDTIRCADAQSESLGTEYVLTLERGMANGAAYVLHSVALYYDALGGSSKYQFTFHGAYGTLLKSWSAGYARSRIDLEWELSEIDPGIEFAISRSENGVDFVPLDMSALVRDGLGFSFADPRVEAGKSYVYKVEYRWGEASKLLFVSEAVRVPAAPLALDQNRPNPFNPSTTVSFTLPVESQVRLEIYDVSGRLVARLIDGAKLSGGPHEVEWNGRETSGRTAASGIYIYRLVAGKETLSRKMVLLR